MKFNGNYLNPTIKISVNDREKITILKKKLFTELDHFREIERVELLEEIENFYTPAIQIEILERIALETKMNLAFNSHFYREKCFYLDANGHAQITSNNSLFIAYVHGFKMLENSNSKGYWIAKNIIKVSLIEHLTGIIKKGDFHLLRNYNKEYLEIFPPWGFELFQYLRNRLKNIESEEFRYTLIYTFLVKYGLLRGIGKGLKYREMVRNSTDIKIKFDNFGKNGKPETDHYFELHEPEMIEILVRFKEENQIESKIGLNDF